MTIPILPTIDNPHPWGHAKTLALPTGDLHDLPFAISCLDLTSLEGSDTPEKVRHICDIAKANRVAAVCVFPLLVSTAAAKLEDTGIKVACAAGGFPHGLTPIEARLIEIRYAIDHGAVEIDIVMNRSAFLTRDYQRVFDEIAAMKDACGPSTMKVILESGELPDLDAVRNASFIAMQAGADFIKTSTGKTPKGATPEAAVCIANAIRDYYAAMNRKIGIKPSGGIRTPEDALQYVAITRQTLGDEWLNPSAFRIGASRIFRREDNSSTV